MVLNMTIIDKCCVVPFSLGSAIYLVENGTHSEKKSVVMYAIPVLRLGWLPESCGNAQDRSTARRSEENTK